MTAEERFLKYITYCTTSDAYSGTSPSSMRQMELGCALMKEMKELKIEEVRMDSCGNVLGTIPAKGIKDGPVLALIAHMDTAPEAPGENVRPRKIKYEGEDVRLSDDVYLTEDLCPELAGQIGKEIIVTDGTTLLGADDKAGIAEIMAAAERIISSDAPHIELRLIFTTDEEIGNGTDGLDVKALGCDYGYTVDGGPVGEVVYENFNGAYGLAAVHGIGVHTGSAKGIMVNASAVAMEFNSLLPAGEVPENTEGYEGFYHLCRMAGEVTEAKLNYIIRDHDRDIFEKRKETFLKCGDNINRKYGAGTIETRVIDSYFNMKEKILPHMHLIRRAEAAFEKAGVKPYTIPIRGGTDGARLSQAGLPCPNLSTGGYNFHGVREWIPVESLEIMTEVVESIVYSFSE